MRRELFLKCEEFLLRFVSNFVLRASDFLMIIGVLSFTLRLHGNRSLKGKRQVASSLKQKLRNKFNLAVSEVEAQDEHERLVLAAVTLSNESVRVESTLQKALAMVEGSVSDEVADVSIELFSS
jgi:uncharacterized protein